MYHKFLLSVIWDLLHVHETYGTIFSVCPLAKRWTDSNRGRQQPTCLFHQLQDDPSDIEVRSHTDGDGRHIRPQILYCDWQVPRCHTGRKDERKAGDRSGGLEQIDSRRWEGGDRTIDKHEERETMKNRLWKTFVKI